jgi:hypothetical protein
MRKIKNFKLFTEGLSVDASGTLQAPYYITSNDSDDEDDAYDKGIAAAANDCDIEENPYNMDNDPMLYDAWNDGFNN